MYIYIYDTVLSTHRRYVYRYILSLSSCRIRIFCSSDESIIHLYFSPLLISCFLPPFLLIRSYPLRIVRSCFSLFFAEDNAKQHTATIRQTIPVFSLFLCVLKKCSSTRNSELAFYFSFAVFNRSFLGTVRDSTRGKILRITNLTLLCSWPNEPIDLSLPPRLFFISSLASCILLFPVFLSFFFLFYFYSFIFSLLFAAGLAPSGLS